MFGKTPNSCITHDFPITIPRGSGWPTSLRRRHFMLTLGRRGSSPGTSKGKTDVGQTPAQKVPQQSGRISVEDRRCKAELHLKEKKKKKKKKKRLVTKMPHGPSISAKLCIASSHLRGPHIIMQFYVLHVSCSSYFIYLYVIDCSQ